MPLNNVKFYNILETFDFQIDIFLFFAIYCAIFTNYILKLWRNKLFHCQSLFAIIYLYFFVQEFLLQKPHKNIYHRRLEDVKKISFFVAGNGVNNGKLITQTHLQKISGRRYSRFRLLP